MYRGKKLSEWLVIYYCGSERASPQNEEAKAAIQHVGTNAVPFVIKWFQYRKPEWQVTLARSSPWWLPLGRNAADIRSQAAFQYFEIMGPHAAIVVPELKRLMLESKSEMVFNRAVCGLCYVGDPNPLLELLEDPRYANREKLIAVIARADFLGTNRIGTVPVLVRLLNETDTRVAKGAAYALGQLGYESSVVVPALTKSLRDSRFEIRETASEALSKFGVQASPALPALSEALSDLHWGVRNSATSAVNKITRAVSGAGKKSQ
jgi:HEAT repeat protein